MFPERFKTGLVILVAWYLKKKKKMEHQDFEAKLTWI